MIHRTAICAGDLVLITGASGGVGSAAVRLFHRRGAAVNWIVLADKHDALRALGAAWMIRREDDPAEALGGRRVDGVIDVVGGPQWPTAVRCWRRGSTSFAAPDSIKRALVGREEIAPVGMSPSKYSRQRKQLDNKTPTRSDSGREVPDVE